MTRVEEDAKDVSRPLFNLTRLRFARSCGMTWCSMHRFYFFSLKLMGWKWNATCYMGCPNLCTKRRQIAGEFWVTVSNLPLKMQSLFKSTEGWCKFVSKSGSGCISWGYFSFSLALYDLGACFSLPWSIHIYCKAKYFLWLCNGNSLQYNPPLLSLFHYRPLLSWDRIIQSLFISHFLSHSRKYHSLSQNLISLISLFVSPSQNSFTCKLRFLFIRGHLHRICWIESEYHFWIVGLFTKLAFFHSNLLWRKWICK